MKPLQYSQNRRHLPGKSFSKHKKPMLMYQSRELKSILLCFVTITFLLTAVSCNKSTTLFFREMQAWGIDISGTTTGYKKPDTTFFRALITARIDQNIDFTIAVTAIGNPSDQAFVIQHFRTISPVDPNEKPSVRDAQQAAIDSLKRFNTQLLNQFLIDVQREVFELKQAKRKEKLAADWTDVNGFLHKAEVLLREPTFKDSACIKRLMVLSDCVQDLGRSKQQDEVVHEMQKVNGLDLFLIGCKNLKPFEGLHYTEFSSIDDIKIFFNQSINNQ